jgi:hypothetical protein
MRKSLTLKNLQLNNPDFVLSFLVSKRVAKQILKFLDAVRGLALRINFKKIRDASRRSGDERVKSNAQIDNQLYWEFTVG